jgi:hypothetical protein
MGRFISLHPTAMLNFHCMRYDFSHTGVWDVGGKLDIKVTINHYISVLNNT